MGDERKCFLPAYTARYNDPRPYLGTEIDLYPGFLSINTNTTIVLLDEDVDEDEVEDSLERESSLLPDFLAPFVDPERPRLYDHLPRWFSSSAAGVFTSDNSGLSSVTDFFDRLTSKGSEPEDSTSIFKRPRLLSDTIPRPRNAMVAMLSAQNRDSTVYCDRNTPCTCLTDWFNGCFLLELFFVGGLFFVLLSRARAARSERPSAAVLKLAAF